MAQTNDTATTDTGTMTLEERLKAIQEAMDQANGDPKEEIRLLEAIEDPQLSLDCEGCQ